MSKTTRSIIFPALAVIIMLIMTGFISFNLIAHNNIILHCECTDFSKHSGHSHNYAFQDEVLHSESHSSQYRPEYFNDFIPTLNLLFTDSYCSNVWQPPKIS